MSGVINGERAGLHGDRLDRGLFEVQQVLADQRPLHGEDAHLQVW